MRKVLFCMLLEIGLLAGAPLRPEEVEELMHRLRRPGVVQALEGETDEQVE